MNAPQANRARALIALLFFLSGACSLVYQVVWVRMLVLVFGTSVLAVSAVLTAFMAGLALGSLAGGRLVGKRIGSLELYALAELGIGVFALAFPAILGLLDDVVVPLYGRLSAGGPLFHLVRFLASFLVLLVPTTLMGATFPALVHFAGRRLGNIAPVVGGLYAINTLGAVAGCALAAFVLLERIGVQHTIHVAAGANLLVAAGALALSRRGSPDVAAASEPAELADDAGPPRPAAVGRLVFWGFAVSGFAALGYEVVWTRLLSMVLRITTTQSLSTILIAFLAGLAAGSAAGAWLVDRCKRLAAIFGSVELLLGLFGLASIALFAAIPAITASLETLYGWSGHLVKVLAVAFAIMLVPTFLMGLLFPVAAKLHVLRTRSLGRGVGGIYAVNTAGAIFGAFCTGFVLIPLLGTQGSVTTLALLNIGLGALVLLADASSPFRARAALLAGLAVPIVALALALPSRHIEHVFGRGQPEGKLLYFDEAAAGTVTVYEHPDGRRLLKVNGAGEVPTDYPSIRVFRLLGNLPMVLHPDPQQVLVIAFGGGITLSSVERHHPRRIDCVEVVPAVVGASRFMSDYNNAVFERIQSPGLHVIFDDGRNHLLRTEQQYDVIISDSTHPCTVDSWVLYTREFYGLARARLAPGGMFAQWLPLHGLTEIDYKMVVRTFASVFPHASLWLTKNYSVLLGTTEPLSIDLARVSERLGRDGVRGDLAKVDLADAISFVATLALDERALGNYAGTGPLNTDDLPYVGFADRLRVGTISGLPATISLLPYLGERVRPPVAGAREDEMARLRLRLLARRHAFMADVANSLGDRQRAVAEARKSMALDPGETMAQRLLARLSADARERD